MIFHVLIAMFAGWLQRRPLGRPCVAEEVEQLVLHMAAENATWGYRRTAGGGASDGGGGAPPPCPYSNAPIA
jgi:hypothetical protein